jgi:ketosteroid isomerase-like protein
MTPTRVSRRAALEAGACALAGAAGLFVATTARAGTKQGATGEEIVRKWYKTWETTDVDQFVALMAAGFTFTSPVPGDDHISAGEFKKRCWDTQIGFIARFDLEHVLGSDDEVFVRYLCHTKNGKSFRNVEYFRLRDGKVEALECYFGGNMTFPSAVSKT